MSVVIDASVVVACLLPDERSTVAERILLDAEGTGMLVPTLFAYEVASALRSAEASGRVGADDCVWVLERVRSLPLVAEQPDAAHVLTVARDCGISVYDAAYLSLALRRQVPLATLDAALAEAAAAAGVTVRGMGRRAR